MFQNEQQRAAVCDKLCMEARISQTMWNINPPEPTKAARKVKSGKSPMSHGERLIVLAAWDIWNGTGKVKIGELVYVLDRHNLTMLGECLKAIANGPHAINLWLAGVPKLVSLS